VRDRKKGQRGQIRIPIHTRKIRVGMNSHEVLWLEFTQFMQLPLANFILKEKSSSKFLHVICFTQKLKGEGLFGTQVMQNVFPKILNSWKKQLTQRMAVQELVSKKNLDIQEQR
jgi:hypothetical protein